jgi:hypothetical protein
MIRTLTAYLAAVLVTYVVAAFAATQSVMNALQGLGAPVTAGVRLDAAWHDLLGMASSYLPIIAIALLIAFPVAALISRALPRLRLLAYPLAGAVAVLAVHLILQQLFNITPVAATRTAGGLLLQVLCGAVGGWVFVRLLPASGRGPARGPGA